MVALFLSIACGIWFATIVYPHSKKEKKQNEVNYKYYKSIESEYDDLCFEIEELKRFNKPIPIERNRQLIELQKYLGVKQNQTKNLHDLKEIHIKKDIPDTKSKNELDTEDELCTENNEKTGIADFMNPLSPFNPASNLAGLY